MRWPWTRQSSSDRLVVAWSGKTLAFVRARALAVGGFEIQKMGVERQGTDSAEDFVRRLQGLGLKDFDTCVMLRPEQYQVLQIDAPAVAPEELRSAARYQIKEMLDSHVDDVTLDVMRVGDGQHKGTGHLFVVVAPNAVLHEVQQLSGAMNWSVSVIDIQETAQRNLQSALAAQEGRADRANAALVLGDGRQAVLTISANEELFYTRRFDLPEGFLTARWEHEGLSDASLDDSFSPVGEYVPDYSVGGVSYGNDYSDVRAAVTAIPTHGGADDDKAQRFLVEVQRSLDVWDRSWSSMPLSGIRVYANERSLELATWLGKQLGQIVTPMDVSSLFPGVQRASAGDLALCMPLLGVLMRTESRKL